MTDRITKKQRSHVMSAIRAKSKLENIVSRALWKQEVQENCEVPFWDT